MTFDQPLAFVLLIGLIPLVTFLGRRRLRRLPGRRGAVVLATRCLLLFFIVAALAQPSLLQPNRPLNVVFAVDVSGGIPPARRAAVGAWIAGALRRLKPADTASLLTYASTPLSIVGLHQTATKAAIDALLNTPAASQGYAALNSNIGAAIQSALGLLSPDGSGRIILVGSGQDTADTAHEAATQAAARHIGIVAVPLPAPAQGDVAITRMDVPPNAAAGGRVPVVVAVHSTTAATATLSIWSDSTVAARQTVQLQPGATSFSLDATASQSGFHTLTAQIDAPGDAVPQNNLLSSPIVVGPAARILIVAPHPTEATPLVTMLRGQGLVVTIGPLPSSTGGLHAYDGVILDDVSAADLTSAQTSALHTAVYNDGKGLVVVGGQQAYSLGHYTNSPLESMLPLWSIPPARVAAERLALVLVLDKSGSMDESEHGVTKIDMVKDAATKTLAHLRVGDSVGVVAFDDNPHWIVPLHKITAEADKTAASHQIAGLTSDSDTVIYPALLTALDELNKVKASEKHIVLLTDGQGENADFDGLVRRMTRAGVTLSTIAVGSDASKDLLRNMANLGGGRFYFADDPHSIPSIFIQDARLSGGPPTVEGTLGVNVFSDSPLLRSLVGVNLPSLKGYAMTISKDNAQVVLQSSLHDPLLASWQYGLGRVAAWTADWTARWSAHWLAMPTAPHFWDDVVRWTLPAASPSTLQPTATIQGSQLVVAASPLDPAGTPLDLLSNGDLRARVQGPDGLDTTVLLSQDAPGHYQARLPITHAGSYDIQVTRYDGNVPLQQATVGVAAPYPSVYAPDNSNIVLLTDLARIAGGVVTTDQALATAAVGTGPIPPIHQDKSSLVELCLLLALLLLPLDAGLRILLNTPAAYRVHQGPIGSGP